MDYIIYDLEFNQGQVITEDTKSSTNSQCPFEIIQIGAIKLNEKLEVVSTFNELIKPELYTTLNPYVEKITNLTMDKLQAGRSFKDVYYDFVKFADSESILCVWGMSDLKELFRNVSFHNLDSSVISKEYINIQKLTSKYLQCPKGTNIGLKNAVELLEIPLKDEFHDAFNDAYYTVEVFKKIYNNKIKSNKYNINKALRPKHSNNNANKIDTYNLIKQFEKMYNREMTEEEKSIIKLAYIMGKTNQFQIKTLDKHELEK